MRTRESIRRRGAGYPVAPAEDKCNHGAMRMKPRDKTGEQAWGERDGAALWRSEKRCDGSGSSKGRTSETVRTLTTIAEQAGAQSLWDASR